MTTFIARKDRGDSDDVEINSDDVVITSQPTYTVDDLFKRSYGPTIYPADVVSKGPWVDVRAFGASGSAQQTTGSITSGEYTLTLTDAKDFANGMGIRVDGAGASGADLTTTISSGGGTTSLTLTDAASTSVTNVTVSHDDTSAIQAALNSLSSGGSLLIPVGTYTVSSLTLSNIDDLLIHGPGTLKQADGTDGNFIYFTSCNRLRLVGLGIDQNYQNQPQAHAAPSDALTLLLCDDCVVTFCSIYNVNDSGIMLSRCEGATVIGNTVKTDIGHPYGDTGIYINDSSTDPGSLAQCTVSNNYITGFDQVGIGFHRTAQRIICSENNIYDCGYGIVMIEGAYPPDDYSKNNTIANNRMRSIGTTNSELGQGIVVRVSHHSNVIGNVIEDCYDSGISVAGSDYCNIIGNNVKVDTGGGSNDFGIHLTSRTYNGTTVYSEHNTITGNIVYNAVDACIVLGSQCNDNSVVANTCESAASTAISLQTDASRNLLVGNNGVAAGLYGININAAGCVDNVVMGNKMTGATLPMNDDGLRTRYGQLRENQVICTDTAIPVAGTWVRGDIVLNYQPLRNETIGWICTTGGTPGSWRSLEAPYSEADVANPPTDANLDNTFGAPATVGAGFMAVVNDAGGGANFWLCASDGTNWWYAAMTKAV